MGFSLQIPRRWGLGLDKLKVRNMALLDKWGWIFTLKQNSLWCKVVCSIHGSDLFHWRTSGKENSSLRSPWINISRQWHKVEALAVFKVGKGDTTLFWVDPWLDRICFEDQISVFVQNSLFPKGLVFQYRDFSIFSWFLNFTRLLKEEEISDFQLLLGSFHRTRTSTLEDKRSWSLESHGFFCCKVRGFFSSSRSCYQNT